MVKIIRSKDKTRGDITYYKYRIPISIDDMKKLGWDENIEIKRRVSGKKFIVESK